MQSTKAVTSKKPETSGFESSRRRNAGDKVFDGVLFVVLTFLFLLVAYPLYFIVISSISDPLAVSQGKVLFWPIGFTLEGYREVFKQQSVMRGFANSLLYTAVGIVVNLICTIPTAYALSRKDFILNKPITFFYIATMFVSGGMMPTYLIVKNTGLLNSIWALVIPGAIWVYNLIVARTFFATNIPGELLEAAKLDGCGNTRFFLRVALPISGAIIAIMVLYYGQGHWNSYFSALLYINDRSKWPLQLELRNILIQNALLANEMASSAVSPEQIVEKRRLEALAEMMKYSLIIISSLPMLVLYPFIQRHFVKGVTIGSVKG
jgi:putative aldouronate transport system permease protein